jgi:AraC-like DNA-binding protein
MRQAMTFWKTVPRRASGDAEALQRIQRSIEYMWAHLNQPLHVAELAAQANFSASHYFALFRRTIGCSPLDFFIRLRMQRACQLIECHDLAVKDVASLLGYDDPFYFSRMFKATCGVAPSDYRALASVDREPLRLCGLREWLLPRSQNEMNVPEPRRLDACNRVAPLMTVGGLAPAGIA